MLSEKQEEANKEKAILCIDKPTEETKVISDEYFIVKNFADSPQKGFELLFRKYYLS